MSSALPENLAWGAVSTPPDLVSFMLELAAPPEATLVHVLEPACGHAPFLAAFAARYGDQHELVGLEIDPAAARIARERVPVAQILEDDFLLWKSDIAFDIIVGNPPYGIIGDKSHYPIHTLKERKAAYKRRLKTWRGKFNIYAAFMERAADLLRPNGKLIFVVPASWLVLDDFALLRRYLACVGKLRIYYMDKAFPGRNVSVVVFVLEKGKQGLELYDGTRLVVQKPVYHGEIIRFETPDALAFEQNGIPLREIFDIYFAARSPQIRRHPQVITKTVEQASRLFHGQGIPPSYVPILTGRNLHRGWIDYERCYSGFWMPQEAAATLRPFYAFPHIVVGHTKGTRVVAALDERCYPWREEFHLVAKDRAIGLPEQKAIVHYLISDPVQDYVHTLYRNMVPHLTKPMLERIPIPNDLWAKHTQLILF
jgi:adenine-specific DNA-methyltransferase